MAKTGRPKIQINWDEFDKLVSYQCTQIEVADFFGISVDCLEDLCVRDRGTTLADIWRTKKNFGKTRLRKAQFAIVEGRGPGAASMAIHLDRKIFYDEQPEFKKSQDDNKSQVQAPIGIMLKSFEDFCTTAGYPSPYPKQVEMMRFLFDETDPRLLLGARGYGKSDYGPVLGTAYAQYRGWVLGKIQDETTLILSKSKTRNTAMIEEIAMALIKNSVPLEKQNATCIRLKGLIGKDHSVEVLTIKSGLRGRHPKRIIMDDPVTEDDSSEAVRRLAKTKYDEAYKLCSNIGIIGQPAHEFDLYAELRGILKKLELPHGSIPELDADLDVMKRAGVDERSIEMSYHLRIPKSGSSIFENINYIDDLPAGETMAFIDPSDGGDYTAITFFRGIMDGMAVKGHVWKKAWYHCIDDIVSHLINNKTIRVAFETNATGSQPILQLRQILSEYGIGVVGVHSKSNKHATIVAAGSYSHLIHLAKTSDKVYTDMVVKYEYRSKHDDAPDSLARGLEWLNLIKGTR